MPSVDSSRFSLGKLPAAVDEKTFRLATYLNVQALPPPPDHLYLHKRTPAMVWPMHGNDRYGDCTCAAAAHMVELWTAMQGREIMLTDNEVLVAYWAITGNRDIGANMLTVLNYWRHTGLGQHTLYAFAKTDTDMELRQSLQLFGGSYIGIGLPKTAQAQTGPGMVWKLPYGYTNNLDARPWSWGGHAVNVVGYDTNYVYVVTWGFVQKMTWGFFHKYCDEAWALLTNDWAFNTPGAFDFEQLKADLAQL